MPRDSKGKNRKFGNFRDKKLEEQMDVPEEEIQ